MDRNQSGHLTVYSFMTDFSSRIFNDSGDGGKLGLYLVQEYSPEILIEFFDKPSPLWLRLRTANMRVGHILRELRKSPRSLR